MIVSINQPAYLPWLGYFERIALADLHVVLDHVQFEKNSFTNRNRVLAPSGPVWLTVPVRTKHRFGELEINRLEVDAERPWPAKHLRTLEMSYGRCAGFADSLAFWEEVYGRSYERLIDVIDPIVSWHLDALAIETPLVRSSELGVMSTKSELVLDLCREVGATTYLSGPLGRDYLELEAFAQAGIEVRFHDFQPAPYRQLAGEFVPGLAAVDAVFRLGDGARDLIRRRA